MAEDSHKFTRFFRWDDPDTISGDFIRPRDVTVWGGIPGNEGLPNRGLYVTSRRHIKLWTDILGQVAHCGHALYEVRPIGRVIYCPSPYEISEVYRGVADQAFFGGGAQILRRIGCIREMMPQFYQKFPVSHRGWILIPPADTRYDWDDADWFTNACINELVYRAR